MAVGFQILGQGSGGFQFTVHQENVLGTPAILRVAFG